MKISLILSLFFSCCIAYASKCREIKNDLLALENKLQNSCINSDKNADCCRPCVRGDCSLESLKRKCVKKKDLYSRYNTKLAQLIIAEGIQSLRLGIHNNYNALNDLSEKHIATAEKRVNELTHSLDKANLLYLALYTNNDEQGNQANQNNRGDVSTLFANYSSEQPVESFVLTQCKQMQFSAMKFCKEFKDYKKSHPTKYPEFLKTLKGFLSADNVYVSNDETRISRFQTYQDKLNITTRFKGENISQTPYEFLKGTKSDHYQKIIALKAELFKLKNTDLAPEQERLIKTKILKQANALDKINIQYRPLPDNQFVYEQETINFLTKNFDDTFEQLQLPGLLIEGDFKDHFIKSAKRVHQDLKRHAFVMQKLAKSHDCNNVQCLAYKCSAGRNTAGILDACTEIDFFIEHQQAKKKIDTAKACLDNTTNNAKLACLEAQVPPDSDIGKIKKELAQLDSALRMQDNTDLSRVLNMKKAMGLKALEINKCVDHYKDTIDGIQSLDCGRSSDLAQDTKSYNFAVDGTKVALNLSRNLIQANLSQLGHDNQLKNLTQDFVRDCESGKYDQDSICQYYLDEEEWKRDYDKAQAALLKKRQVERRKRELRNQELDAQNDIRYGQEAVKQFFASTALYSMPLIGLATQTSIMKTQSAQAKMNITWQKNRILNNIQQFSQTQNQQQNFTATNFGVPQLGTSLGDYQSFQAENQVGALRRKSPFQFRMSIPGPVNLNNLMQTTTENRLKKQSTTRNQQKISFFLAPSFSEKSP